MNTIKNVGTKLAQNKRTKEWVLLDYDGWPLFSHKLPSIVRKAKHHWFVYLTGDLEVSQKHLQLLESLND